MTTTSAIAAWEAEGLRLLGTSAKAEDRAELRAAAERIALASRARSAPGFDRCASMVCSLLAPPDLCVVATCSRSMKRVARADHVWRPLTAQRFTCAGDLRRAGSSSLALTGFEEYSRMTRIWDRPDNASPRPAPGMDAYSVVLEIKIGGQRIAGGVYELDVISDSPWAGEGFGFYDFDRQGRLTPAALENPAYHLMPLMTLSICVVRKSDKKCLHLVTDVGVDTAEEDYIIFDGYRYSGSSSFNDSDGDYQDNATHDFRLYGAVWDEDEELYGFLDPHAELILWDPESNQGALPTETILKRWHASKNWV